MWAAIHAGGYDEYLSNLRSGAPHNNVHPDALLTLAKALGVSGSSYDITLPGLTARKAADIFWRATDDQGWLIITYGTPGAANGGQADCEQRFAEFTATMMRNLPSSPECFRYALGKYYFRLAGPLQALHELLQPAPRNGTEALTLIDQLHSECHGATAGGTASTALSPPGSKLALSRLCDLIRPHLGAADADQELVTATHRMRFVRARVREDARWSGLSLLDRPSSGVSTATLPGQVAFGGFVGPQLVEELPRVGA